MTSTSRRETTRVNIARNRETLRGLHLDEAKALGEEAEAQKRLNELELRSSAIEAEKAPLQERISSLGRSLTPTSTAAAVGLAVGAIAGSPLFIGFGLAAATLTVVTVGVRAWMGRPMDEMERRQNEIGLEQQNEGIRLRKADACVERLRKAQEKVEKAIADAQGLLDTMRMATAAPLDRSATVRQEKDHGMVGSLKLPRNAGGGT